MNIKRFYAPTAREALAKARMVFGDGTLILSNRQTFRFRASLRCSARCMTPPKR